MLLGLIVVASLLLDWLLVRTVRTTLLIVLLFCDLSLRLRNWPTGYLIIINCWR
jgi:hypothetical protein